jgi:hypothetical protein
LFSTKLKNMLDVTRNCRLVDILESKSLPIGARGLLIFLSVGEPV